MLLEETLKKNWNGRIIKVELIDRNQKAQSINKSNLQGFFNRSNNSVIIEDKLFEISFQGFHNAFNFLFVYAVAKELGIEFKDTNKFNFVSLNGRNKILKSIKTTIYDETYNASPESVKACIDNLLDNPNNHFLIFGSMQELGNKSNALKLASNFKLPILGNKNSKNLENTSDAQKIAKEIGLPVVIKAAYGGGGKGMKVFKNSNEIDKFFSQLKAEAKNYFGDDTMYAEKFLTNAKHIEFQVISDPKNNYAEIIGQRDCSIQRKNQKIVEERWDPPTKLKNNASDFFPEAKNFL
mgnify:CR=1 FL=1